MIGRNGVRLALVFLAAGTLVFGQTADRQQAAGLPVTQKAAASEAAGSRVATSQPTLGDVRQQVRSFLDERLTYWQGRLNLREWQISVVMTRRADMKPRTLGKVRWDKPNKTAVIEVLDVCDYTLLGRAVLDDMELTVVHELVHLELASLPRSQASRSSEEYAVNQIAEALVGLNRRRE